MAEQQNNFPVPFIINTTPSDAQLKEVVFNGIDYAANLAQQVGITKIEDALIETGVEATKINGYPTRDIDGGPFNTYTNMFGQTYIGKIILCKGGQQIYDSNNLTTLINKVSLPELHISTCLIQVNQRKAIIRNQVLGRDGSIKTYMNTDDYEIQIEATITLGDDIEYNGENYNGIYPVKIIQDLISICEAPVAINITSDYLNLFGIDYVVIEEYNISQEEGRYSEQKITLTCYSDDPTSYQSILNF
jgi:hypothetical protein